jgi:CTP:molybdopterin cytidylyltransferase MocA
MTVAAVVLASGQPEELSQHQQLMQLGAQSILETVLNEVKAWPVDERLVVLGHDHDRVMNEIDFDGFTVVVDFGWETGSMSAIRAALDHLTRRSGPPEDVILARGDQVATPVSAVEALVQSDDPSAAVVPVFRFERGYPVMIRRAMWDRLLGSDDDADLLKLLDAARWQVAEERVDELPPRPADSDRAVQILGA